SDLVLAAERMFSDSSLGFTNPAPREAVTPGHAVNPSMGAQRPHPADDGPGVTASLGAYLNLNFDKKALKITVVLLRNTERNTRLDHKANATAMQNRTIQIFQCSSLPSGTIARRTRALSPTDGFTACPEGRLEHWKIGN